MSNPLNGILGSSGGGSGGGTGDVVGPASSTDNAVARWDLATGKLLQNSDLTVSDLAAGAITITAGKGTAITLKNTNPDATTGASVAGDPLAITAGDAVASTDTAGAAAGGAVTITSGAAARNTSGNANGGDINLTTGAGIGTGTKGVVNSDGVVVSGVASYNTSFKVGTYAGLGWDERNVLGTTTLDWTRATDGGTNVSGFYARDIAVSDSTQATVLLESSGGMAIRSDRSIVWANGTTINATLSTPYTADTGLARSAAGVVKVTDGSTGIRGLLGGGTAVASATAMPLPTGRVFHVTGTTAITSITSTNFQAGAVITLIFDDVLTFTDGNNLKLAGDFTTSADDTITLAYDGTNWYECSRSVN